MGHRYWWSAFVVGALAIGLPLWGTYSRRQQLPQCALDGVAIVPTYAVEIDVEGQPPRRFCCIRCAQYWLDIERESLQSISITVVDEVSAQPLDARDAVFVRSPVTTNAVTGNNIHAFAAAVDAREHADQFHGRLLNDHERPFHEVLRR